ncbi:sucrose-6-phosphate hydrolase-like [Bactrocera neohumeralis]|uniref:sucrose-6-phosphate hydrolase-like n=1 Tax=Bactrocera neohumeralis TaxID=98809 RepID=UPI00216550D2|nr:sucrose-6-phosphate hydrolase-like [Bactrocera neohumeralis]
MTDETLLTPEEKAHIAVLSEAIAEIAEVNRLQKPNSTSMCPRYHLVAPCGWMGSAPSVVWFNGQYHAYYSFSPFALTAGDLYIGHSVSNDLLRWEHKDPILAPEAKFDNHGCRGPFAVVFNNMVFLYYTGMIELEHKGETHYLENVCLASSGDGETFQKLGAVISPFGGTTYIGDPIVWKEGGFWYMTLAIQRQDQVGDHVRSSVALYRSYTLYEWDYMTTLLTEKKADAEQWTAPQIFSVGDATFMALTQLTPLETTVYPDTKHITPDGQESVIPGDTVTALPPHENLHRTVTFAGEISLTDGFKRTGDAVKLDIGSDMLLPRIFDAPDGRKILLGWANMWGDAQPTIFFGFAGSWTLPREVELVNGQLHQKPIVELEQYRVTGTMYDALTLTDSHTALTDDNPSFDFELVFDLDATSAETFGFSIGAGYKLEFEVSENNELELTVFSQRNYYQEGLDDMRALTITRGSQLKIYGVFDRSLVELFIDGLAMPLTARIMPGISDRRIYLYSMGGTLQLASAHHNALSSF